MAEPDANPAGLGPHVDPLQPLNTTALYMWMLLLLSCLKASLLSLSSEEVTFSRRAVGKCSKVRARPYPPHHNRESQLVNWRIWQGWQSPPVGQGQGPWKLLPLIQEAPPLLSCVRSDPSNPLCGQALPAFRTTKISGETAVKKNLFGTPS